MFRLSPQQWRDRAEQMRVLAFDVKDESAKEIMLGIAREYDKLAAREDAGLIPSAPAPTISKPNGYDGSGDRGLS
jgi:hypothetical protein